MKPDEILEKSLSGELTGDALSEEMGKLSVEDQAELHKLSKESAATSLGEATALRKEKKRAEDLKVKAEEEAENVAKGLNPDGTEKKPAEGEGGEGENQPPKDETMTKFRKEQKDKAITRFNGTFKDLTDEQRTAVLSHFESIDSGAVDSDNIYNEIIGAYAFVNRDSLIAAQTEKSEREATAAAEAAADAAGASGKPGDGNDPPKYAPNVTDLAQKAGISEEAAQKIATEGNTRTFE